MGGEAAEVTIVGAGAGGPGAASSPSGDDGTTYSHGGGGGGLGMIGNLMTRAMGSAVSGIIPLGSGGGSGSGEGSCSDSSSVSSSSSSGSCSDCGGSDDAAVGVVVQGSQSSLVSAQSSWSHRAAMKGGGELVFAVGYLCRR